MENKNYKEEKFDSFLTKTIILSSKRYFKKEINTNRKEQIIFDDQNYSAFIQGFFASQNPNFESTIDLSLSVKEALKSLSAIEQSVIFLLFNEDLSQKEAAQILEIYSKTVSKIKIRAIDKLKKYFWGFSIFQLIIAMLIMNEFYTTYPFHAKINAGFFINIVMSMLFIDMLSLIHISEPTRPY